MGFREKVKHEIKAIALATVYFGVWIGALMMLKELALAEYRIEFHGMSRALVGALILAKVVLVMEYIPLGSCTRTRPAVVDVILRTLLYAMGLVVVLILERALDGWREHGGFGPSLAAVFQNVNIIHVWINTLCLSGALLSYNVLSVVRRNLGEGGLARMFLSPMPPESHGKPL